MAETRVVSFVLRFVEQAETAEAAAGWHGVVRHVQSREEKRFVQVEEALAFIDRYVDLQQEARVQRGAEGRAAPGATDGEDRDD